MSATLDANLFSNFFTLQDKKPSSLEIPGRTFPVDISYKPVADFDFFSRMADGVLFNTI